MHDCASLECATSPIVLVLFAGISSCSRERCRFASHRFRLLGEAMLSVPGGTQCKWQHEVTVVHEHQ
eukprot:158022-Pyramimonas_sp.AAC.1